MRSLLGDSLSVRRLLLCTKLLGNSNLDALALHQAVEEFQFEASCFAATRETGRVDFGLFG